MVVVWLGIRGWKDIGYIREVKGLAIMSIGFLLVEGLIGGGGVIWEEN
ncbi:hypothetical protein [Staphylococcus haemolyticus]|nr:hypothetical protein [Staphylococcus haemolyticus]